MPTSPVLPEITPLQDRAIRRFEYDRDFHVRVYAMANALERTPTGEGTDLAGRLRYAMTTLQEADEKVVSDEAIVRGAHYLGGELLGLPYALATVPEQEGLKAGVRRLLAAVNGTSG